MAVLRPQRQGREELALASRASSGAKRRERTRERRSSRPSGEEPSENDVSGRKDEEMVVLGEPRPMVKARRDKTEEEQAAE